MKQDYMLELMKQFLATKNLKHEGKTSAELADEFLKWIKNMQKTKDYYLDFLTANKLFQNASTTCEVGKSPVDSILQDTECTIISPFNGFNPNKNNVIEGDFKVYDGIPYIAQRGKSITRMLDLRRDSFREFATFNPYTMKEYMTWSKLANESKFNIMIGIFGQRNDMDIDTKIKLLREFKESLTCPVKTEYDTYRDEYYIAIKTDKKI